MCYKIVPSAKGYKKFTVLIVTKKKVNYIKMTQDHKRKHKY